MVRRLSATISGIILIVITGCTSIALKSPSVTGENDDLEPKPTLAKANVKRLEDDLFHITIKFTRENGELEVLETSYINLARLP